MLRDGTVDLAILNGPIPPLNMKLVPLLSEKIARSAHGAINGYAAAPSASSN